MAMAIERATEFMRLVDNGQISGRISEWPGLREACGAIYAHLSQPAQAVDTGNLADDPLYKALDALYERGWTDGEKHKHDPRGTNEWMAVLNLFRTRALAGEKAEGYVLVRKEAIDWLNGESDFECPPERYFRGEPPRYWWRSVFREKAGLAAPTPPTDGEE